MSRLAPVRCGRNFGVELGGAEGCVAGFGLGVGRVEARERKAGADFVDDPGFELFLLDGVCDVFVEERGWDDYGAVVIGDDDVIREDCYAAAGDRKLPAYKGQAGDRCGCCRALAPNGQMGAEDSGEVANDAVSDEAGDFADADTLAEDVAEDACVDEAPGVDYGDTTRGHVLNGGAGGGGGCPGCGGGEDM